MGGKLTSDYIFAVGDIDTSVSIMQEAAQWLIDKGVPMWCLDELTKDALQRQPLECHVMYDPEGDGVATLLLGYEDRFFFPDVPANTAGFIHKLAVRRRWAGKGLANKLIDHAVTVCKKKGMDSMYLDCDPSREKLCRFYEQAGFVLLEKKAVATPRMGTIDIALYKLDI